MKKKGKKLLSALTDTHHPYYFWLSDILAVVTVISILAIVLETLPGLKNYESLFLIIEWVTVIIFTVEYIWRLIDSKKKISYVFSWFGIIDLVSILPTYLGLGNLTFLKSARVVRLMRLLRLLRVSKMKSLKNHNHDGQLSFYTINVLIFVTVLISATLIVGILIYIVEGHNVAFQSIPHGMWWAFRIFTNDPTFIRTETIGGEAVYILARLVGLIVFGALIGILGNIIKKVSFGDK